MIISQYNCQSLRANSEIVQGLLKNCDILCLQETLVDENNSDLFENLNSDFLSAFEPAVRRPECFSGRSSGGLGIMWRKDRNFKCKPLKFDSRIMGLEINFENGMTYLMLNIYMICDYGNIDCYTEFKSTISKLGNIITTENFHEVCLVGDFNADPNKGRFFSDIVRFAAEFNLHINDISMLPSDSYTYISSNYACSTSWLDHILSSSRDLVSNPKILYGTTVYDHIPVSFNLKVPHFRQMNFDVPVVDEDRLKINWEKINDEHISDYAFTLDNLCQTIFHDVLLCNVDSCQALDHKSDLDGLYEKILDCIFLASTCFPTSLANHKNRVVGWNFYCKTLYNIAREKYFVWHFGGRMRQGEDFDEMKAARSAFKNSLNYCKSNERRIKSENLLRKFKNANKSQFWKEVKKYNSSNISSVVQVDDESNLHKIVDIFDVKYQNILNDPHSQTGHLQNDTFRPSAPQNGSLFSMDEISNAIISLNSGYGWDEIHANHLKFSGPIFQNLIGKFFNKCISHNYVPVPMIYGEIRPVIKCKALGKGDSNNYRPVMNSGMFIKVLEYCLLEKITDKIRLNKHQFGFRKQTGCLQAIAIVKETIFKYNSEGSNVHCATVDLSKAFDKLNWKLLFNKLASTDLKRDIIDFIRVMYDQTFVHTLFNGTKSCTWKIGNGVRQGGILSPFLFCFYLDSTLDYITNMPIGCEIMGYKTNMICFADDVMLLSPSAAGLQLMLDVISDKFKSLCLAINANKSGYILFKRKGYKSQSSSSVILLNGEQLAQVDKCKYLGVFLTENGNIAPDIDRVTTSFLRQFNAMYSKFHFAQKDVRIHLFKAYTSSFYGIDVWFDEIPSSHLNKLNVSYHKAVKKICGMAVWDSNHAACEIADVRTFPHLLADRLICFWHRLWSSDSVCTKDLSHYFRYNSIIFNKLSVWLNSRYFEGILNNPLCAIRAHIRHKQRNEPRSYYALQVDIQ